MPWRVAASIRLSSARPVTAVPFNVKWTGFGAGFDSTARSMTVSTATRSPSFDFLWKVLHHGQRRVRRRLSEAANRCVNHRLRELRQERLIPAAPLHQREGLGCADATGRALPAGFLRKELHEVARGFRRRVPVR